MESPQKFLIPDNKERLRYSPRIAVFLYYEANGFLHSLTLTVDLYLPVKGKSIVDAKHV